MMLTAPLLDRPRASSRWLGLLVATLALAACGGGGSSVADSVAGLPLPQGASATAQASVSAADLNATISGVISFAGDAPRLGLINMSTEQICDVANKQTPQRSQEWVVGAGGGLANVLVQIKTNLPAFDHAAPSQPLVFDQTGCLYAPHVFGMRVGQTLQILNPDRITHNVNAVAKVNRAFNAGMPGVQAQLERTFDRVEDAPFSIRCNVHPWMTAWAAVLDHPYYAVTGPDGSFSIPNLPAGTYELEIWHEVAGTQIQTITVGSNATAVTEFTISA
jgi:plastocyanin